MARIAPIVANSLSMLKLARAPSLVRFAATLALAAGMLGQPYTGRSVVAPTASAQTGSAKTATAKSDKERSAATSKGDQAIVVLVNDDPVTAYQIDQRARFLSLSTNLSEQAKENFQRLVKAESTNTQFRAIQEEVVRANQGKSREQIIAIFQERQKQFAMNLQKQALDSARAGILPKLKNNAKEELIDERLKLQEAKKLGIEVSDADVKRFLQGLAESNKMTHDQFAQHLKGMGVDMATMAERMRAQRAWRELISRRYGGQVAVTQRDVDRVLSSAASESGDDTVELQVSKITLGLSSKIDQTELAKRFTEAEALRRKFGGCRSLGDLAKGVSGAKFEDMKFIKPATVPEPTRSMLLSAKDGDMLPPSTTTAGVEIYAVCGRRTAVANDAQRTKTQEDLQGKQLEILAQRHMRNLRQDAHIEYR
jgi:peptidyl-prolyl cis-trans isomerase SurA